MRTYVLLLTVLFLTNTSYGAANVDADANRGVAAPAQQVSCCTDPSCPTFVAAPAVAPSCPSGDACTACHPELAAVQAAAAAPACTMPGCTACNSAK